MRNNYPLVFSRSRKEHSFLSPSESEISQELQAVYTPICEELETGRELEAAEKDVQTVAFDTLPLPSYPQPRYLSPKLPTTTSRLVLEGRSLGQTQPSAQLSNTTHKVVRLKRTSRRIAPQLRSVSAQRSLTEVPSLENQLTYEDRAFRIGRAELPPTFPISLRRTAVAGALVTSKTKREAVLQATSSLFATDTLNLVLAFQPRTQVYSAAFTGDNAPLSRCCRETLILEFSKSGEMSVKCSNQSCSPLQILHLASNVRQRLWVEEGLQRNNKLSSSLSLFIQRGAFKIRPIRRELDRVKYQQSRPQTTAATHRRGKAPLIVLS